MPPGYGGDADGNGLIDYRDYQFWKDHFGNGPATTTSSNTRVPEPGTLLFGSRTASNAVRVTPVQAAERCIVPRFHRD